MQWTYDSARCVHELQYGGTVLARIFVQMKEERTNAIKVKAMVSALYYGTRRAQALERRKKEWVTVKRKFKEAVELEQYLERKKAAVVRFIEAREREM